MLCCTYQLSFINLVSSIHVICLCFYSSNGHNIGWEDCCFVYSVLLNCSTWTYLQSGSSQDKNIFFSVANGISSLRWCLFVWGTTCWWNITVSNVLWKFYRVQLLCIWPFKVWHCPQSLRCSAKRDLGFSRFKKQK